jgi:triacylglycerol lipase
MNTDQILARLSELAYYDGVRARLHELGMEFVCPPFDHAGSQGMLVRSRDMAALVFRGTEASAGSVSDITSNLGVPVRWAGNGRAHSGYARHFSMIRYEARKMAELVPSEIPLYVTGHSMGGCLATLYASWVGSGSPEDHWLHALVTYGAPKALSVRALADMHCKAGARRYTNKYDFAPHWPPVLGLTHPKLRVRVDSGGWPGPVSRHGADRYVEAVDLLCEREA